MTCRELVELVTEYLEGALPAPERVRFEAHLEGCVRCGSHLEQMQETIRTLGRLPQESLSEQARHDLMVAFRGWRSGAA